MDETSHSPLRPIIRADEKPNNGMDFPDAMREVINGNKVFRIEWEDKQYYGFLNGNILSLHKPDGKNYQWIVSDGDMMAKDWIVI